MVEYKPENNNYPSILAAPTNQKDQTAIEKKEEKYENEYLRDFNLFLFNNRFRGEKKKKTPFYFDDPAYKHYLKLKKKV